MQFKSRTIIIISSILYLCVKKQHYLHPQDHNHTRDDESEMFASNSGWVVLNIHICTYMYVLFLVLIKNLSLGRTCCEIHASSAKSVGHGHGHGHQHRLQSYSLWLQLRLDSCIHYHLQVIVHAYSISVKFRQNVIPDVSVTRKA